MLWENAGNVDMQVIANTCLSWHCPHELHVLVPTLPSALHFRWIAHE